MAEDGGESVDPVISAALAKAVGSAGAGGQQEATRLIGRVLGPAADEVGEALRRYTALRMQNVGRVITKADKKRRGLEPTGIVSPRVAHRLLEEGSYCDDELMAEYLAGLLAAGQTPTGRDDRAVSWAALVASMSTLQIRAHFLFYREWAARLHGREDLNLGLPLGVQATAMHIELAEFIARLVGDLDIPMLEALSHSVTGIARLGLIQEWAIGSPKALGATAGPYEKVVFASPTLAGIELYGWAQGISGMSSREFLSEAKVFGNSEVPRLTQVAMPRLQGPRDDGADPQE